MGRMSSTRRPSLSAMRTAEPSSLKPSVTFLTRASRANAFALSVVRMGSRCSVFTSSHRVFTG